MRNTVFSLDRAVVLSRRAKTRMGQRPEEFASDVPFADLTKLNASLDNEILIISVGNNQRVMFAHYFGDRRTYMKNV